MSDLILDDAQQMLADSVRKYVERGYGDTVRRASIDHPQGCSPDRQLHGAIGMSEEYAVGQFIKRLALASTLYGGVELQLERLAEGSLGDRSMPLNFHSEHDHLMPTQQAPQQAPQQAVLAEKQQGPLQLTINAPRLVYGQVSGFGQSGPASVRPGFETSRRRPKAA